MIEFGGNFPYYYGVSNQRFRFLLPECRNILFVTLLWNSFFLLYLVSDYEQGWIKKPNILKYETAFSPCENQG